MKRLSLLLFALMVLSATVLVLSGCAEDETAGADPTSERADDAEDRSANTMGIEPLDDTSSTAFLPTGDAATAQAEAALLAFFGAWQAQDETAVESMLTEERQQAIDWQFEDLERVEFGAVTTADEEIDAYMNFGRGSEEDMAREDVRCFRASVTFYYKPGAVAAAESGDELNWVWFLVRNADGEWRIDDWGY